MQLKCQTLPFYLDGCHRDRGQLFSNVLKVPWPSDWRCFSQYCFRCGAALTIRGPELSFFFCAYTIHSKRQDTWAIAPVS